MGVKQMKWTLEAIEQASAIDKDDIVAHHLLSTDDDPGSAIAIDEDGNDVSAAIRWYDDGDSPHSERMVLRDGKPYAEPGCIDPVTEIVYGALTVTRCSDGKVLTQISSA